MNNTIKSITMAAMLLFGMGVSSVPQAMAGESVLEKWRLPWGLKFGAPIPGKVKRKAERESEDSETYRLPGDIVLTIKDGGLSEVVFDKKEPRAFKKLGLEFDKLPKMTPKDQVKKIIRSQGGEIILVENSSDRLNWTATFGSSPYEFRFAFNADDDTPKYYNRLIAVGLTEALGAF